MSKIKSRFNFRLSERDISILKDISEYKFLTLAQINDFYFFYKKDYYCDRRLKQLIDNGFLTRIKTYLMSTSVFILGEKGRSFMLKKDVSLLNPKLYLNINFRHRISVNSLHFLLGNYFSSMSCLAEGQARSWRMDVLKDLKKNPDVLLHGEGLILWVEAELSLKSRASYKEILQAYKRLLETVDDGKKIFFFYFCDFTCLSLIKNTFFQLIKSNEKFEILKERLFFADEKIFISDLSEFHSKSGKSHGFNLDYICKDGFKSIKIDDIFQSEIKDFKDPSVSDFVRKTRKLQERD